MRKALTFLSASLAIGLVMPVKAQVAPDMFRDVPQDHWAYQAVDSLRSKGILIGYPDGYFRGKRTLTRYEFAVALQRLWDKLPAPGQGEAGPAGPPGPAGEPGPAGSQGPAGVTPEELQTFRNLATEFRQELARLGTDVNALNAKFDNLAKKVADLENTINKMPKITGAALMGMRVDTASHAYVDKDGRALKSGGADLTKDPVVVHQLALGISAKVGSEASLNTKLLVGNYSSYLGDGLASVQPLNANPKSDLWVDQLELSSPVTLLGKGASLSVGRYLYNISPLTLWRPDVDSYFDNPLIDDGMYRLDGFKIGTGLGSVGLTAFAGQNKSVQSINGAALYLAGAGSTTPFVFKPGATTMKPSGQPVGNAPMVLEQLGGVTVGVPVHLMGGGNVRATAYYSTGKDLATFTQGLNAAVLGAGFDLKFTDAVSLTGEWAKSVTGTGRDIGTGVTKQNQAFTSTVGYNSGALSLSAGYKYIDPLFYAPGYWGKIGNWLNPTNIQGPMLRAGYEFTPAVKANLGADWYQGARNWQPAGMGMRDEITRVLAGLRWDISKSFNATVDYEGVFWKLNGALNAAGTARLAGNVHPTENYLTVGTGFSINDTTALKLGYQYGMYNGRGPAAGLGEKYNFGVWTSQLAVKF